ncbi:MAG: hypothetical protein Q9166_003683 [cf. Caloplaca sp. 2 TL-2023]
MGTFLPLEGAVVKRLLWRPTNGLTSPLGVTVSQLQMMASQFAPLMFDESHLQWTDARTGERVFLFATNGGQTLHRGDVVRRANHPLALATPIEHNTVRKTDRQQVYEDFVKDLRHFLGVQNETISIVDLWEQEPPVEAGKLGLTEYLGEEVATRSYVYSFWQKISEFYDSYRSTFDKLPFMPPPKGIRLWDRARSVSLEQHKKALERLNVYKSWLLKTYLQAESRNVFLVLPLEEVTPLNRDEWPGSATSQESLIPKLMAS